MLRALRAYNEAKNNQITCLGTAVTYHRRCRNPLRAAKLSAVLAEMVEAAEDPYALLGDSRFLTVNWAHGLSCYLHGAQNGVAMAALGAVAVYRLEAEVVVIDPARPGVWKERRMGLTKSVDECEVVSEESSKAAKSVEEKPNKSDAVSEGLLKAAKSPVKNVDDSNAVTNGSLHGKMVKQWKKLHVLEMALLSLAEAILKLCASIVWLYLSVLLVYASIVLLLGKK